MLQNDLGLVLLLLPILVPHHNGNDEEIGHKLIPQTINGADAGEDNDGNQDVMIVITKMMKQQTLCMVSSTFLLQWDISRVSLLKQEAYKTNKTKLPRSITGEGCGFSDNP
jgi:hypothetical protein